MSKLFIGSLKDAFKICRGGVKLSEYLVWSQILVKQTVLQGVKVHPISVDYVTFLLLLDSVSNTESIV